MKKIFLIIGTVLLIIIIVMSLIVYRNIMLDKGMLSLKEENSIKAIHYLRPLAVLGDSEAQNLLGDMYAFGLGVEKNNSEAIKWFRRADNAAEHEYYVAERYRVFYEEGSKNPEINADEALKWYRISAEGDYPKAAEFLGKAYAEGLLGLTRDFKQSRYWYEMSKKTKADKKEK